LKNKLIPVCLPVLLGLVILWSGCSAAAGRPAPSSSEAEKKENTSENAPEPVSEGTPQGASDIPAPEEKNKPHILVAWFSATGTTEKIAQKLAEHLSADLYEILPEVPYTAADLDYTDSKSRTSAEQNDASARPAIDAALPDTREYDLVFIGYPIWHGQAPRIISTFLEGCDLAGRTVVPFCTSGSSDIGASAAGLQPLEKDADWMEGTRFSADAADEEIAAWADGILLAADRENVFYLYIGDTVLSAEPAENSSAEALKELLADGERSISMEDYGGFEKTGPLGAALPRNDETLTAEPGDIILYQGDRIAIYYGENTWELTRLGRINGVTAQKLKELLGEGDVSVTFSFQNHQ
jgi:flavodoxin